MKSLFAKIGYGKVYDFAEFRKRNFYEITYFARRKNDFIMLGGGRVENRGKKFFHSDRRTAAVNISRERQQVF